jgi:hypothetical protein
MEEPGSLAGISIFDFAHDNPLLLVFVTFLRHDTGVLKFTWRCPDECGGEKTVWSRSSRTEDFVVEDVEDGDGDIWFVFSLASSFPPPPIFS